MTSSVYSNPTITEAESDAKTFVFPDKCFNTGMGCVWRQGSQLTIYPRCQEKHSETAKTVQNIVLLNKDIILYHPIIRKLLNESNSTFLAVQKAAESSKTSDNRIEFLKLSRQYRSIIRSCIENLQEDAENMEEGLEKNKLHSYITIFYSIECVWNLCEILYIDILPGDVVLPALLDWVRYHFPCHEQVAAQILEACERGSEDNPAYWDTIVGMIVQGRVEVARALMKLHSCCDTNEFKLMDHSLKIMPVYSAYGSISTGEFTIIWKQWQAECRAKLSSRILANYPELELILRLVIGDYAAFEHIRDKYDSWFNLMGGWVMYNNPWCRRRELSAAAAACAGMRGLGSRSHLDALVRVLFDGDLHMLIHEIQQMSDNLWFATHLTDLLYHCDHLKIMDHHQINVTVKLRDSLILDYGCMLMEHKSLWPVGLSYLTQCAEGTRQAELLLERIPIHSESKALRIISEAKKYGLFNVAHTVCSSLGSRHLGAGRCGAALAWAMRGRCSALAARAADALLHAYCRGGELRATDLLLAARSALLINDRLLLLGKYCEFHRLYKSRDFKKASGLLISLITARIAPEYFWETLLLDSIPLLESDDPVFSSKDTTEIMRSLEMHSENLSVEKADLLRLALARNLARTLINEEPESC